MGAMNKTVNSGFEGFLSPIVARMQFINVYMDFEYWYMQMGQKISRFVSSYLRQNKEMVEEELQEAQQTQQEAEEHARKRWFRK